MNRSLFAMTFSLLFVFASCRTAGDLIYEPAPTDPLDGYKGYGEQGPNGEMDWGPKQNLLLSEFKALKEKEALLKKEVDELKAENRNLQDQLGRETGDLQKEKSLRAQAEAETDSLREKCRDREARILSLSIEKAKLEQAALLGKIEALRTALEPSTTNAAEAAAPAPRGR